MIIACGKHLSRTTSGNSTDGNSILSSGALFIEGGSQLSTRGSQTQPVGRLIMTQAKQLSRVLLRLVFALLLLTLQAEFPWSYRSCPLHPMRRFRHPPHPR